MCVEFVSDKKLFRFFVLFLDIGCQSLVDVQVFWP